MARDDNDILDIETDDRDVDRTAKKLRSLDKLLQQTQRRVALLGKTRIKPILALDDRLTTGARKAEEALTRLQRTTAKPVVQLSDRVSATALKLQDSLAALAAAPWQLTAAGVDWEAVVGDSFAGWVSSEGKSTLKRISSAIGEALGFTGKVASSLLAPESKGLAKTDNPLSTQPKKKGPLEKTAESFFGFTKNVRKDVSKDYAKEGTKELVDKLFSIEKDKKVECKCEVTCNCNCGSGGGYIGGTGSGRKGKGRAARGSRPNRRGTLNLPKNTALPRVDLPKPSSGRAIKGSLKKIGVGLLLNTGIDMLGGGGVPELITKGAGTVDKLGANLLGKAGGLIGKIGKGIKLPGPLGLLSDATAIASAKNNKDRVKATTSAVASSIGGFVGGAVGSIIPGAGTAIGATLGAMGGDFIGDKLGGFMYNLFSKKKEKADKKVTPKSSPLPMGNTLGLSSVPQLAPSLAGINPYAGNVNRPKDDAQNKSSVSPQVNVSLSQGALSLTVNKDEINYDELAKAAGWKIANEVRFAMQNLK
ncbi:hypothetical protein IM700_005225 [Paenibacillus sp. DXFW5]|uniref:Uncharacterized protein n=1 Tax=Paenibacillus rhizolycopersici TaxID=2780073 RepID=A0ABS2H143_9BACL|nr:hypothetical protein [Paenibacillus rhizolycopersici]MBM6995062.1 hypothetical protein [Paenibacillus rhizolycopersici]